MTAAPQWISKFDFGIPGTFRVFGTLPAQSHYRNASEASRSDGEDHTNQGKAGDNQRRATKRQARQDGRGRSDRRGGEGCDRGRVTENRRNACDRAVEADAVGPGDQTRRRQRCESECQQTGAQKTDNGQQGVRGASIRGAQAQKSQSALALTAHHCCTTTVAPILVRLYRSMMSSFDRRMQPEDTPPPSFQGSLVPWMRYSVPPR